MHSLVVCLFVRREMLGGSLSVYGLGFRVYVGYPIRADVQTHVYTRAVPKPYVFKVRVQGF